MLKKKPDILGKEKRPIDATNKKRGDSTTGDAGNVTMNDSVKIRHNMQKKKKGGGGQTANGRDWFTRQRSTPKGLILQREEQVGLGWRGLGSKYDVRGVTMNADQSHRT